MNDREEDYLFSISNWSVPQIEELYRRSGIILEGLSLIRAFAALQVSTFYLEGSARCFVEIEFGIGQISAEKHAN
jgi:hypothetical protein